jgi:arylsulfatase A-like enzyme
MNVDLAPTILKAAGGTAGRAMDGIALQNTITSPSTYADRTVAIETGANPRVPYYSGIHNDYWHLEKIVAWGNLPTRYELYDLRKDPYQLKAVQDDARYASVLETLKTQLEALNTCKGRACDSFGNIPASP